MTKTRLALAVAAVGMLAMVHVVALTVLVPMGAALTDAVTDTAYALCFVGATIVALPYQLVVLKRLGAWYDG